MAGPAKEVSRRSATYLGVALALGYESVIPWYISYHAESVLRVRKRLMRIVMISLCAVLLGACSSSIAQTSNDQSAIPARQESPQMPPCKPPKVFYNPPASPPASWAGGGPKSATTRIELTVDKKGRVQNPAVVQSGGKDVDRQAIEAIQQWKFTPAMCGTHPIEAKIQVQMDIHLQ